MFVCFLVSFGTVGFKRVELTRTVSISVMFQLFMLPFCFLFLLSCESHRTEIRVCLCLEVKSFILAAISLLVSFNNEPLFLHFISDFCMWVVSCFIPFSWMIFCCNVVWGFFSFELWFEILQTEHGLAQVESDPGRH